MKVYLPIRTYSEANRRDHHFAKARRVREQRQAARHWVQTVGGGRVIAKFYPLGRDVHCTVKLTRIAPRELDDGDNLSMSMKAIRDGIADALGIDDRDPRVEWEYDQRKGEPKEYAVEVTIK